MKYPVTAIFLTLLFTFSAFSQEEVIVPQVNKHLKRIDDMRTKILWHLGKNELKEIHETIRKTDKEYYRTIWLSRKERFLINFISGNTTYFRGLEKFATDYMETIPEPGYEILVFDDQMEKALLNYLRSNKQQIKEAFTKDGANESELDFAEVFLLRYKTEPHKEEVNSAVAEYVDDYPFMPLTTFVEETLPIIDPPREWQYGMTFFTGSSSFSGTLGQLIPSQWAYGMTLDVYYGNWGIIINNQFTKPVNARQELEAGTSVWTPEARYKVYYGSLDFGYRLSRENISITPFVGIALQHIHTSDGEISINSVLEPTRTPHVSALSYGAQVAILLGGNESNLALRLRVGRSDAQFEERYDEAFQGSMTFFNFGLGFQ